MAKTIAITDARTSFGNRTPLPRRSSVRDSQVSTRGMPYQSRRAARGQRRVSLSGIGNMEELTFFWIPDDSEAPINISLRSVRPLMIPKLLWYNVRIKPHKTKVTNNGYSVFVTSKWGRSVPFLTNGFLGERKFLFYNIHFHWADRNNKGSEHKINGEVFPFEMHVLWRNEAYRTARKAKKELDGILIVAYLFAMSTSDNPELETVVECLKYIEKGGTSTYMKEPMSVSELMPECEEDFFLYTGCLKDSKLNHQITWVVNKQPLQVGINQLKAFRSLLKKNGFEISNNSRPTVEVQKERTVYYIRPPSLVLNLMLQYRTSRKPTIFQTSIVYRSPFVFVDMESDLQQDLPNKEKYSRIQEDIIDMDLQKQRDLPAIDLKSSTKTNIIFFQTTMPSLRSFVYGKQIN